MYVCVYIYTFICSIVQDQWYFFYYYLILLKITFLNRKMELLKYNNEILF